MASTISAGTTAGTAIAIAGDTSGVLTLQTNGTTNALTLDASQNLQFNSGYGSVATAYGCRAWVNFNGQGTVAIRASGNVSSIGDLGVGNYRVNFTNAMPDANYAFVGGMDESNWGGKINTYTAPQTTSVDIYTFEGNAAARFDPIRVYVAILR